MKNKKVTLTPEQIRKALIKAGVNNLKEFGYPGANEENILTDYVYSKSFKGMLEENLEICQIDSVKKELTELLTICNKTTI